MNHLVLAPAWVGDMVMAHTLVQVIQAQDTQAHITMLAPPATLALASRMRGVNGAVELPVAHGELGLVKRLRVARELRAGGTLGAYQQAYVLPNSFKSALTPWLAGIETRTGWHGESRYLLLNDRRRLDPTRYPLMVERFMALGLADGESLASPYPQPQLTADPQNTERLAQEFKLHTQQGTLALCPGAEFGPAKRWPAEHYAVVAAAALAVGQQVWLLGSPKDQAACQEIEALLDAKQTSGLRNLAGRTLLLDAVDLLAAAQKVVCNDSGLMHIACAVQTPVVALFGSTSPDFTPPLGPNAQVLQHPVPCSPCFQRVCPLGHMDCLQQLSPQAVLAQLQLTSTAVSGLG